MAGPHPNLLSLILQWFVPLAFILSFEPQRPSLSTLQYPSCQAPPDKPVFEKGLKIDDTQLEAPSKTHTLAFWAFELRKRNESSLESKLPLNSGFHDELIWDSLKSVYRKEGQNKGLDFVGWCCVCVLSNPFGHYNPLTVPRSCLPWRPKHEG